MMVNFHTYHSVESGETCTVYSVYVYCTILEDKWVEPPYFKALTSILSGNLVIPSGELATADIFPEPEMEISRRPPYSIPTGKYFP